MGRLSDIQLEKLSDISSDIAAIALASVALPSIFDKLEPTKASLGFILTFLFWSLSLWLLRKP